MNSSTPISIFTQSWSTYDLITEYNYMFHREIYATVHNALWLRYDRGPYTLLDLGCGNARYLASCLKECSPLAYEGVDLSEPALREAREYLGKLPGQVTLTHGDMLTAIESTTKIWDVIFTGFAVHHMTSMDKARFFRAAERCLATNGWLIMVDVVREENQSREDYLDQYLKFMREQWNKVPPDQLEEACAHVHDHDYPECLSTLRAMASRAGLQEARVVARHAQHHMILFSRATATVN